MLPDYNKHRQQLLRFILDYQATGSVKAVYMEKLRQLRAECESAFEVDLDHIAEFTEGTDLFAHMVTNAKTYVTMLGSLLESLFIELDNFSTPPTFEHTPTSSFRPVETTTPYLREIYLLPPSSFAWRTVRSLRASDIGSLVKVRGIVTRTSDVTPSAQVITYVCDVCGKETLQNVRAQLEFTPLMSCSLCKIGTSGKLYPRTAGSNFVKYQELRLQELPEQVPTGHIPYSLIVKCFGTLTRECVPGKSQRQIGNRHIRKPS